MARKKGNSKPTDPVAIWSSAKGDIPFYGVSNESTPDKGTITGNSKGDKRDTRNTKKSTKVSKGKKSTKKSKQSKKTTKKSTKKATKKPAKVSKKQGSSKSRPRKPGKSSGKSRPRKRNTTSKSQLTKRLDRQNVYKLKGGKTPSKKFSYMLFESVDEPTKEQIEDLISRALAESKTPLMQVRIKGTSKESEEEKQYSTRMFPVYLDMLPSRRFYNSDSKDVDGIAEEILFEINQLVAFYDLVADSFEYFIMWD